MIPFIIQEGNYTEIKGVVWEDGSITIKLEAVPDWPPDEFYNAIIKVYGNCLGELTGKCPFSVVDSTSPNLNSCKGTCDCHKDTTD